MTHDPNAVTALGRIRLAETTLAGFLDRVAMLACEAVPGAEAISITLAGESGSYTAAAVGEPSGAAAVLSIGLPVSAELTGVLTLHSRSPRGFSDEDTVRAEAFAGYAAVAVANAHSFHSALLLASQMQAAMGSRAVIEQAKGVIMAQRRCSADEAFAQLTKASQDANRKVRDVAAALVAEVGKHSVG
ncbi:GAF and ANTAR domain-containing protein [Paractinoplanes lichenicola]|uniref:GAF and ANTAR domain-containing protein n=1 Tax=Paractinoplanes lichenicola TaxID=2802976 RepID=A0ABS1VM23_9ACTN|nr:GAF and ANTAR domain-containing protein [Actinoplanes lichenicola]MBL7255694.1 GAF and ANTAR domain-containing protein [Actinoplanes lichenicola]